MRKGRSKTGKNLEKKEGKKGKFAHDFFMHIDISISERI